MILALDCAEKRTGFALGRAGEKPRPQIVQLRDKGDQIEVAAATLARFMRRVLARDTVDLICLEHYLPGGAASGRTTFNTIEGQVALHFTVRALATCYGVRVESPYPMTVRKHFCGTISGAERRPRGYKRTPKEAAEDREKTKIMVLRRAQLLGYIPRDCYDDDLADAAAIFDYASSTYGRAAPAFVLTPGRR